eukprot:gene1695-1798_t
MPSLLRESTSAVVDERLKQLIYPHGLMTSNCYDYMIDPKHFLGVLVFFLLVVLATYICIERKSFHENDHKNDENTEVMIIDVEKVGESC